MSGKGDTWIESLKPVSRYVSPYGPYADEIEASAAMDAMGMSALDYKIVVRTAAPEAERDRQQIPQVTVRKGDRNRIIPEAGPERVMIVAHVEHHIITMCDPLD